MDLFHGGTWEFGCVFAMIRISKLKEVTMRRFLARMCSFVHSIKKEVFLSEPDKEEEQPRIL